MKIDFNPTIEKLNQVQSWLYIEYIETGAGSYSNWKHIERSFNNNKLLVCEVNNRVVGFISWIDNIHYATIDLMNVHPNYRNNNYGSDFYKKAEVYLIEKGFKAIQLYCRPVESEKFWQKMDFIKYPNISSSMPELTYYKILIDVNFPNSPNIDENDYVLELWDLAHHEFKNQTPKWRWNLGSSTFPIFHPANQDWYIKLTYKGKLINDRRVKWFYNDKNLYDGCFLYIELKDFIVNTLLK